MRRRGRVAAWVGLKCSIVAAIVDTACSSLGGFKYLSACDGWGWMAMGWNGMGIPACIPDLVYRTEGTKNLVSDGGVQERRVGRVERMEM